MSEWDGWLKEAPKINLFDPPDWLTNDPKRPWQKHDGGEAPVQGRRVEILTEKELDARNYAAGKFMPDHIAWSDKERSNGTSGRGRIIAWRFADE